MTKDARGYDDIPYILANESEDAFYELLQFYIDRFQPANIIDEDMVADLASLKWRYRRCTGMLAAANRLQDSGEYCSSTTLAALKRQMNALRRSFSSCQSMRRSFPGSPLKIDHPVPCACGNLIPEVIRYHGCHCRCGRRHTAHDSKRQPARAA